MALTRTPQTDSKTKLGRYELLRELATSNVATSWLARPIGETFEVTLLKVHRHMAKSQAAVDTLLAEAQGARKFAHDNVAGVLDAGVVDGEPFIVTEYVGESLASLLRSAGPAGLPIPIALRISIDILEGFAAAHSHDPPLGHGEIGPWCVFVGSDGVARVGGFGVDQAVWRFGAHYVKNMERLSYAAPERVKSMSSTLGQELSVADEESDLFGAAILVFELLTRQRLFASKMEAAVVQKVLTSPIPTAQSFRPEIPIEVSDALKQALVRDRSERLVSFEDFIVALEGAGPALIGSNEAVAEMVAIAGEKPQEKRSVPPPPGFLDIPGSIHEMLSSAGTPGALTKPAPVPGRATLMFDEIKGELAAPRSPFAAPIAPVAAPKTPAATSLVATPSPPAVAHVSPPTLVSNGGTPRAPSATVNGNTPAEANKGAAPVRARAKTLMGFGALRANVMPTKESPPAPPVAEAKANQTPAAPIVVEAKSSLGVPPAARSSSIELRDSDIDVQIEDPLTFPTTILDLPGSASASLKIDASPFAPVPEALLNAAIPPPGTSGPSKTTKPGHRRTSTLLGIAPVEAKADIEDPPTEDISLDDAPTAIMDEATTADPPKAKDAAALSPAKPGAPVTDEAPKKPESAETKASDPKAQKPGKRAVFSSEMLRTGAVLPISGTAFELIAPVARGGMATVWAAREVGTNSLDKMVAIKTMLPELSDDVDFESMFLDEARVAAKIRHPNVASIIDLGQEDSLLYLVMEWVDGENIGTIQRAARVMGGMPTPIIMQIASEICSGLHEAHELRDDQGHFLEVVHRDISPANVLVGRDGCTKIVDFGIAKSKGRLHVTKVGAMVKGKTPYLSPEQIGGLAIDRRSDLFSLGALLYVMSSGLHPFRGETELATIENIAIKAPVPLRSIVGDIDPGFEQVVLRLLEKDPKKRFQTALEVKEALEKLAASMPNRAGQKEVAAFLEKTVGDKLDQRVDMLKAGLERMERRAEMSPEPLVQENTPSPAAVALKQVLDKVGQSQPDVLNGISFADATGLVSQPASPIASPPASPVLAPASDVQPSESAAQAAAAVAAAASVAAAAAAAPPLHEFAEERVSQPPRTNVKRLAILIGVGLMIGLAIVGGLEALRGSDTQAPSASASSQSTAPAPVASQAPTAAAPPSGAPSSAPTEAPTETAAPASPPSAIPSSDPTTAPTAAPVSPNPHPQVTPGQRPPIGHPPTSSPTPRPKPPVRKYNPATI